MAEARRRVAALRDPESLSVLWLDNVGWAGPLLTSSDPERIASVVRHQLAIELGITVEVTEQPEGQAAVPPELPAVDGLSPEVVRAALAAAAGLERRSVPVAVWQEVAQALAGGHGPVPLTGLRAVAEALPGLVVLDSGTDGGESVRFVEDAQHHAARETFALSATDQDTVTGVLRGLWPAHVADTTGAYIAWALPVHAALAGSLPRLLTDAAFVAHAHWYALWQGLALAYPEGVPAGGLAADVHYLQAQGVVPATQQEWAAWLHHAAVSRGDTAFADALADRAGPLPWRTLWSRWRLPGKVGSQPEVGWVEGLYACGNGENRAVAHRREPGQPARGGSADEPRGWDASTGQSIEVGPAWSGSESVPGVTYAVNRGRGWELMREPVPGVPRAPRTVGEAVRLGGMAGGLALWVFAGTGGIYGAEVDERAVTALPRDPWPEPFGAGPLTRSAPWPPPWPLPVDGGLTREWLEDPNAFRTGACRPLPEARVPAAVRHEPTRRFLSRLGWPLSHGIGALHAPDLNADGLRHSDDHPGLLSGLGQVGARRLLLDGADGRVFLTYHNRDSRETHLAGSSLDRLLVLLLLQHTAWSAPLTLGGTETEDLAESLVQWCRTVDPEAAASAWEGAFHDLDAAAEDYAMVLGEIDAWTP
jgi:hypothetical protein